MFRTSLLYITPPDGIPEGETEQRFIPLTGLFAIKTCKGGLERALRIETIGDVERHISLWVFSLDGFLIEAPDENWRDAAGFLSKSAFVLGRRLSPHQYNSLITIRAADKQRGIDLSAPVNLNEVAIPNFGA